MTRVLLTDGTLRKTLAAVRALGALGYEVNVADRGLATVAGYSKYCSRRRNSPSPEKTHSFKNWLLRELTSQKYDVFVPMDDLSMDLAVECQDVIGALTATLVPDSKIYMRMRDKFEAVSTVSQFGISVPKTTLVDDELHVKRLIESTNLPFVFRPSRSSGSRGLRVIHNEPERRILLTTFDSLIRKSNDVWMIQSFIPVGERIDVCLLADSNSDVKASFVQRELRHFPIPYGPSTAQESVHLPELVLLCREVVKQIGWRGVIEFEFVQSVSDGLFYFMETNTRFWNSLHLAILCGVNFPKMYCDLALGQEVADVHSYRLGVRTKSLLPADLLYMVSAMRQKDRVNSHQLRWIKGSDDIISISDFGPTLGMMSTLLKYGLRTETWKMLFGDPQRW